MDDKLFTAAVTVILICTAALALMNSSAFSVTEITVHGNSYFTDAEIAAMAGLTEPTNLFRISVKRCEESLESSSKIEKAVVRKVLPKGLSIDIVERKGIGLLPYNGALCEIDGNGVVITEVQDPSRVELPVLTGLHPTYLASGEKAQPARIVEAAKAAGCISPAVLRLLRELNAADTSNLVGYLKSGAMVVFGDSRDLRQKSEVLMSILQDSEKRGNQLEYIDVSTPAASIAR